MWGTGHAIDEAYWVGPPVTVGKVLPNLGFIARCVTYIWCLFSNVLCHSNEPISANEMYTGNYKRFMKMLPSDDQVEDLSTMGVPERFHDDSEDIDTGGIWKDCVPVQSSLISSTHFNFLIVPLSCWKEYGWKRWFLWRILEICTVSDQKNPCSGSRDAGIGRIWKRGTDSSIHKYFTIRLSLKRGEWIPRLLQPFPLPSPAWLPFSLQTNNMSVPLDGGPTSGPTCCVGLSKVLWCDPLAAVPFHFFLMLDGSSSSEEAIGKLVLDG